MIVIECTRVVGRRSHAPMFQLVMLGDKWVSMRENLSLGFAAPKGQTSLHILHPRSLIRRSVIRFLENIISKLATSKFSYF